MIYQSFKWIGNNNYMKIHTVVVTLLERIFPIDHAYQEQDPQLTAIKARQIEDYRYLHLMDKFRH